MADRRYLSKKDRFAQLLSEGFSTAEIKERMGLTRGQTNGYFQRIKQDLGPQAYG